MAIKVEVCGRLLKAPEVRMTPAGTTIIKLVVDCGSTEGEFVIDVVMTGDNAREVARRLVPGRVIKAAGLLRQVRSRAGSALAQNRVEVIADSISPAQEISSGR